MHYLPKITLQQTTKINPEQLSRNKQSGLEYKTHSDAKRFGNQIWNGWEGLILNAIQKLSFRRHSTIQNQNGFGIRAPPVFGSQSRC